MTCLTLEQEPERKTKMNENMFKSIGFILHLYSTTVLN